MIDCKNARWKPEINFDVNQFLQQDDAKMNLLATEWYQAMRLEIPTLQRTTQQKQKGSSKMQTIQEGVK